MKTPLLSRGSSSSPLGKLTFEIPKFRVDEETGDILSRAAHEAGYGSLIEFVRELLTIRAHGVDHVRSLYEQRLQCVARNGNEKGRAVP